MKTDDHKTAFLLKPGSGDHIRALRLADGVAETLTRVLANYSIIAGLVEHGRLTLEPGETVMDLATAGLEVARGGGYVAGFLMNLGLLPNLDTEDDQLLFAQDTLRSIIKDWKHVNNAPGGGKSYRTICQSMADRAEACLKYRTLRGFRAALNIDDKGATDDAGEPKTS